MAKQYVFTKDIAGSNNGYEVVNYNKNQVIEQKDLSEYLFNAWLKAGVIKDLEVGEDVKTFSMMKTVMHLYQKAQRLLMKVR